MATNRFNPDPDRLYATCETCGIELADPDAAADHRDNTMAPIPEAEAGTYTRSRSHTTRASNLTRAERINHHIAGIVEDALREYGDVTGRELDFNDAVDDEVGGDVDDLVLRDDITRTEAETALRAADASHIQILPEEYTNA